APPHACPARPKGARSSEEPGERSASSDDLLASSEGVSAVGADGDLRRQKRCPDGLAERRVARALQTKAGVFARRVTHGRGNPRPHALPPGVERVAHHVATSAITRRPELVTDPHPIPP